MHLQTLLRTVRNNSLPCPSRRHLHGCEVSVMGVQSAAMPPDFCTTVQKQPRFAHGHLQLAAKPPPTKAKHCQDEGFRETYQPVKELPFTRSITGISLRFPAQKWLCSWVLLRLAGFGCVCACGCPLLEKTGHRRVLWIA